MLESPVRGVMSTSDVDIYRVAQPVKLDRLVRLGRAGQIRLNRARHRDRGIVRRAGGIDELVIHRPGGGLGDRLAVEQGAPVRQQHDSRRDGNRQDASEDDSLRGADGVPLEQPGPAGVRTAADRPAAANRAVTMRLTARRCALADRRPPARPGAAPDTLPSTAHDGIANPAEYDGSGSRGRTYVFGHQN